MSTMRCDLAALKPTTAPFPTFSARKLARRRLLRRRQMRLADLGLEAVLGQRRLDPRNQIAAIGLVIDMLQLAPAAFRESDGMAAWWCGPATSEPSSSNVSPGTPNATWLPLAVTPSPRAAMRTIGSAHPEARERCGIGVDEIVGDHLRPGDLGGAAVKPDRGAGRFERLEPPRPQRGDHPGQHIAGPRARQPRRRRRREAEPPVRRRDQAYPAPCNTITAPDCRAASSARSALVPSSLPNRRSNSPSCGVRIASCPRSRSGSPRCVIASASMHLRRMRGQRQRQQLRDVAHARPDQQAADPLVVDRRPCRSGRSLREARRSAATC